MQIPRSLIALALSVTSFSLPSFGEVMIAPTRIVLERGERSAELVLVNKGNEEAAFRVSIENRRMLESGAMELAEETRDGEYFAKDLIRYSPRRLLLEPESRQTIRVSANMAALEEGEYRSHLRVMSAPTSAGRSLADATAGAGDDISIQLVAIRSLTIPIILRVGALDVSVELDTAYFDVSENVEESVLTARLKRTGTKSTFGDIQVFVEGQKEPIYFARGIAIYTPNLERDVKLPIPETLRAELQGQQLRIAYVSSDPSNPETYAELRTTLE